MLDEDISFRVKDRGLYYSQHEYRHIHFHFFCHQILWGWHEGSIGSYTQWVYITAEEHVAWGTHPFYNNRWTSLVFVPEGATTLCLKSACLSMKNDLIMSSQDFPILGQPSKMCRSRRNTRTNISQNSDHNILCRVPFLAIVLFLILVPK